MENHHKLPGFPKTQNFRIWTSLGSLGFQDPNGLPQLEQVAVQDPIRREVLAPLHRWGIKGHRSVIFIIGASG